MKKISFLTLMSLLLVSCKIDSDKWMENFESAGSGESAAMKIVAYNNALIKLSDNQHSYLKSLDRNLGDIFNKLENPNDPYIFLSPTPMIYSHIPSYDDPKLEEPGNEFEEEDKEFFRKNVLILNQSFESIRAEYAKLEEYVKAEDYKDDQGKAGKEMISQIDQLIAKYYDTNEILTKRIVALTENAEREVLKSHPFKDHIFAMKDASNAVADFVTTAYEKPENYSAHEAKFKELYDKIESLNLQREKLPLPKNSDFPGKEIYFSQYNQAVNNFLIAARKIMRDANSSGNLTQINLNDLAREEENIRTAYNNFVD